ncbi:MAG: hypothetical protein CMP14_01740 [Rickettsiales bacterium]|nr:hypothetical protein [Rickettsiales bacterium]
MISNQNRAQGETLLAFQTSLTGAGEFLEASKKHNTLISDGCVRTCGTRDELAVIKDPEVKLVIWQRELSTDLSTWLEQLRPAELPDLRVLTTAKDLTKALHSEFDGDVLPNKDMRDLFVKDIHLLVTKFAAITRNTLVDVRLERISHDACWKFHFDAVEKRLLTTYRGPNTEWIQPEHSTEALRKQRDYSGPIESLKHNDVAIFKGSRAETGMGIVHRSPPIADTGFTRLLLCLNAPSIVSPEPWLQSQKD